MKTPEEIFDEAIKAKGLDIVSVKDADLYEAGLNAIEQALSLGAVSDSLPHESQIESALDKLMIIRGEHPTRVRNPLYGEERQLAKDLVKYVLLSNER